ncbi:Dihydrofolate reductase, partial [hydrothermal vent metagenome]
DLAAMIAHARALDVPEVMIIGGSTLYQETLPICDRVYMSQVEAAPKGDTFFPKLAAKDWQLIQQTPYPASQQDEFAFVTQVFERR